MAAGTQSGRERHLKLHRIRIAGMPGQSVFLVMIFLLLQVVMLNAEQPGFGIALAQATCLKISPNVLMIAPGLSIAGSIDWGRQFTLACLFHMGNLFGYDFTLGLNTIYQFSLGAWTPGIGMYAAIAWGSMLFLAAGNAEYYFPVMPEYTFGILVKPLQFSFNKCKIAFLSTALGTDILYPFRLLAVDLELLSITLLDKR